MRCDLIADKCQIVLLIEGKEFIVEKNCLSRLYINHYKKHFIRKTRSVLFYLSIPDMILNQDYVIYFSLKTIKYFHSIQAQYSITSKN